ACDDGQSRKPPGPLRTALLSWQPTDFGADAFCLCVQTGLQPAPLPGRRFRRVGLSCENSHRCGLVSMGLPCGRIVDGSTDLLRHGYRGGTLAASGFARGMRHDGLERLERRLLFAAAVSDQMKLVQD